MAQGRRQQDGRQAGGAGRSTRPNRTAGGKAGRAGATGPVVARSRPWGLIAAAAAVVVFAAAVISYAVVQVNRADAGRAQSVDEIGGVQTYDYTAGQQHGAEPAEYEQSPPVAGPHDEQWADCTGTVYGVDIRDENAVHSLEHGGTWIVYDPDQVDQEGIRVLTELVEGTSGTMLSPRSGLGSAVSVQAWNNQLKVDSASDPRIEQFVDLLTFNPETTPEPGASCENPAFVANPVVNP